MKSETLLLLVVAGAALYLITRPPALATPVVPTASNSLFGLVSSIWTKASSSGSSGRTTIPDSGAGDWTTSSSTDVGDFFT